MITNLVSIVTVTYNAEAFVEETILSVLNQTYSNIEYIIIDGNSNDNTLEIIKKYEDSIAYWVSEPDEGIYHAMNKAIEKANGEWINFMNAGDTFFDNKTVADVMHDKETDTDLIYGNCQIGTVTKKPHDATGYTNLTSICHQTLFTKTTLMKNTPFNTNYKISADHDFILKMFQNKKKFQYLDKSIAHYLLDGLSGTEMLRLYTEGLFVLFSNNVPEREIMTSPWYEDLTKYILRTNLEHTTLRKNLKNQKRIIHEQKEQCQQLSTLKSAIKNLSNYSIWKHPLQKYKSYKAMLKIYYTQEDVS